MSRSRRILATFALVGVAGNTWVGRPDDAASFVGWLFATLWVSGVWLLVLITIPLGLPTPVVTGVLISLGAWELFALVEGLGGDGLFLAVKPVYGALLAVIGGLVGLQIGRLRRNA
jgi:hypothetical protein